MHRPFPDFDINEKDENNCAPLHIAILYGHLECVEVLLEHGAKQSSCEGSRPIHITAQVAAMPHLRHFAVDCTKLLLKHGASAYDRDDFARTPLHWAAQSGCEQLACLLMQAAEKEKHEQEVAFEEQKKRREEREAAAAQNTQEEGGAEAAAAMQEDEDDVRVPPPLVNMTDKQGFTAIHYAARVAHCDVLGVLLGLSSKAGEHAAQWGPAAAEKKSRAGLTALHRAAQSGCLTCVEKLVAARPLLKGVKCKKGRTAADYAARRGYTELAAKLGSSKPVAKELPRASKPTLIVAPKTCLDHHTVAEPIRRGSDVPPENANRLRVLLDPGKGALRTSEFSKGVVWEENSGPVALADVTRVHEWSYIKHIQEVCARITDHPAAVGHLDGDTAVSHKTFQAALHAAGAVTHAVDKVMNGEVKNAFCAVRPPGHHAGPTGVVTGAKDPTGSHGFCLLNNVAIGAAYALHVYRHQGIKRVAVLDFDVHHGNGTEACVTSVIPATLKARFKTPFSEGVQTFPVWRPWLDDQDPDRIFFASVQGYGPKAPGLDAFVYPGSGATCDTRPSARFAQTTDSRGETIEEDPENEFAYRGGEMPPTAGPRVINVGIDHPGPEPLLWKRAWRDKILPALVKFGPDMIFISAGFDAHRKDEINFGYLGVLERDFEWITEQLVQVANRCCQGRLVSVLEGGYRIQGEIVSAFARSVAAHVRAMKEHHSQEWDPAEAKWEREKERESLQRHASTNLLTTPGLDPLTPSHHQPHGLPLTPIAPPGLPVEPMERGAPALAERKPEAHDGHVLGEVRTPERAPVAGEVPHEAKGAQGPENGGQTPVDPAPDAATPAPAAAAEQRGTPEGGASEPSRKRRRGPVDYAALNKQLEEEKAQAGKGAGDGGAQ
ncbi:unnamed protein product [Pedinophyceae sp. YPF-701]|nr:unnamed protein product [Pedinophyceae sp. YPF-701]